MSTCLYFTTISSLTHRCVNRSAVRGKFQSSSHQPLVSLSLFWAAYAIASAALSGRSVCLSSVCRVVDCDHTVQDRPIVCIEVA